MAFDIKIISYFIENMFRNFRAVATAFIIIIDTFPKCEKGFYRAFE